MPSGLRDFILILRCMSMKSRRAQILMEPDEYTKLEQIAKRERKSVSELIRTAVRDRYFMKSGARVDAARAIGAMELELDEWDVLKAELEAERGDRRATLP